MALICLALGLVGLLEYQLEYQLQLPPMAALPAAATPLPGLLGFVAFDRLTLFFAVWGIVQIAVLWRGGWRPDRPDPFCVSLFLL